MATDIQDLREKVAGHEKQWNEQWRLNRNLEKRDDEQSDEITELRITTARIDQSLSLIKWFAGAIALSVMGAAATYIFEVLKTKGG